MICSPNFVGYLSIFQRLTSMHSDFPKDGKRSHFGNNPQKTKINSRSGNRISLRDFYVCQNVKLRIFFAEIGFGTPFAISQGEAFTTADWPNGIGRKKPQNTIINNLK